MSDPCDNFPLARANDFPEKKEQHPRTAMLDLLEEIRIVVKRRPQAVSDAQVLVVLASVMEDHVSGAFHAISSKR